MSGRLQSRDNDPVLTPLPPPLSLSSSSASLQILIKKTLLSWRSALP